MFVNIISHFVQFKLMFIFNIGYYVFDIIVLGFVTLTTKKYGDIIYKKYKSRKDSSWQR